MKRTGFLFAALLLLLSMLTVVATADTRPDIALDPIGGATVRASLCREFCWEFNSVSGVALADGFASRYRLSCEVTSGDDYLDYFDIEERDGRYTLVLRPADNDLPAGCRRVGFKVSCEDNESGRVALSKNASFYIWFDGCDIQDDDATILSSTRVAITGDEDNGVFAVTPYNDTLSFSSELDSVTLDFDGEAQYTVPLGNSLCYRLYFDSALPTAAQAILDAAGARADVLRFCSAPVFDAEGELELHTVNPYLYRYENGAFTLINSVFEGNCHRFYTARLGCFVAVDRRL